MPVNPCSVQWYLFKLKARHYIISRLREFLRFRLYLKSKPPVSFDFDGALQTSLVEFQTYHRLKVTDRTLNEETWAAVGAEMTDVEFQLIFRRLIRRWNIYCVVKLLNLAVRKDTNGNCLVTFGASELK